MKSLILILLLCVCLPVSAQKKLPEYGAIEDLKGMERVYVLADSTDTRKFILDELKKHPTLKVVAAPEDGQFILECVRNGEVVVGGLIQEMPTFEMTAYTLKDDRQRIAWSRTKTSLRPAPTLLTRDFVKALKKIK